MATTVSLKPNAVEISGSTSGTTTLQATAVAGTTTLTLPAATDTLVGKATTDTLTNKTLTGAAMNGTLGATTPSTVAATTLTTSSTVTHNGGTANGVGYLDGSKVLTTGSALAFNGSKLGIGVTSFDVPLQVQAITGGLAMRFNGRASPADGYSDIGFYNSANTTQHAGIGAATSGLLLATNISAPIQFQINSAEAGRFDSSGNLLVGTTSATYKNQFALPTTTGNGNPALFLTNADTTNPRGLMYFANGSASGDYAFLYQGAGANKFYVVGSGAIYSTSTSITSISDVRHKENIRDLETGLAEVISLRPRRFDWKEGRGTGEKDVVGFIAQEVEAVLPDLISAWKENAESIEEFKALTMGSMLPTLVKAIQEQQALITQLQADVAALKGA